MYERFTDRARKVMQFANQEAQRFNNDFIEPEHILLGLLKEGSGVASKVFENKKIDVIRLLVETKQLIQIGPEAIILGKLLLTPQAIKVIEYAMEEASGFKHNYVGTEHILLALLRIGGTATQMLNGSGLELDNVRDEITSILGLKIADRETEGKITEWLFATTAEDVAKEYRTEALESAQDLKNWVDHIIDELSKCRSGAFDAGWIDGLIKRTYSVAYQIGQANGAVLVRGVKPKQTVQT